MAPRGRSFAAWAAAGLSLLLAVSAGASAAPAGAADATPEQPARETSAVALDGRTLFRVVGVPGFPAATRAGAVSDRIEALAADASFDPGSLSTVEVTLGTSIQARGANVVTVTDQDVAALGLPRDAAAVLVTDRIKTAIGQYRQERTPQAVGRAVASAAGWTALLVLLSIVASRVARRLSAAAERWFDRRAKYLRVQGLPLVNTERTHDMLVSTLRSTRVLVLLGLVVAYLLVVFDLFPWTRAASSMVVPVLVSPLRTLWHGFIANLPSLVFLAVVFVLMRGLLRLLRTFFQGVEAGTIRLSGFDREWALPTFRIVRLVLVAFAIVLAYPHIPGSESGVFKGISIFAGVLFSLGSSSIIANVIAGYTMTYRRAFRVGDRVAIGDVVGDVQEVKVLVTRVRTPKNEEVVIPNSSILAGSVVNYSALAGTEGLIIHATVGIGYETPWRQVEAMLVEAAQRTRAIERNPPPFVVYRELGDFCVSYEINGYTHDARAMVATRTELQRNILDVFNEYGVQIMTPAYEGDTPQPKIVPRDQWYAAPARAPAQADEPPPAALPQGPSAVQRPFARAIPTGDHG